MQHTVRIAPAIPDKARGAARFFISMISQLPLIPAAFTTDRFRPRSMVVRHALTGALIISTCLPAFSLPAATTTDPAAVAEVRAGKRTEARAAWWGFDPADSTRALQSAINSGARRVIVENMSAPWITDKLILASDQEILFEKGVIVQAKRGAFRGKTDCLFSASLKKNITLSGEGATLRMWKQDYDDAAQYQRAEWRHVLGFWSCAGVRVSGLTLADSGGDGIYLGVARRGAPCSDVAIKGVTCANNYRQGISVISARDLLIEDCVLKDTWGTAPEAGIDFEPNDAGEELVNCVMRNCVSENNRGDAMAFYLRPLRGGSKPLSLRIENCRAIGGRRSVSLTTANDSDSAGVKGSVEFVGCSFARGEDAAIVIGDKPLSGARVTFKSCEIIEPAAKQPEASPIQFTSRANGASTMGGVRFEGCVISEVHDRKPMSYRDMSGGVGLAEITGTLVARRGGASITHELTPALVAEWMPFRSFKSIARFDMNGVRFEPALPGAAVNPKRRSTARQRGVSAWLLWASAGEEARFSVLVRPVGKGGAVRAPVSIVAPSGKTTALKDAAGDAETEFVLTPAETGAHRIVCDAKNWTATVNSPSHRICLIAESAPIHLLSTTGEFFFWVPPGAGEFAVKVAGDGDAERVGASLRGPSGIVVATQDSIGQAHQFVASPRDAAMGEVWSLQLAKPPKGVLEDFTVQLQGVPPVLAAFREDLLKPAGR